MRARSWVGSVVGLTSSRRTSARCRVRVLGASVSNRRSAKTRLRPSRLLWETSGFSVTYVRLPDRTAHGIVLPSARRAAASTVTDLGSLTARRVLVGDLMGTIRSWLQL